jgi:hypothetical protein
MDVCVFCYEPRGLVRAGCACRGELAIVHVKCLVRAIVASGKQELWIRCFVCTQEFTGVVTCALARARRAYAATFEETFYADVHAIDALCEAQRPDRAERMARGLYCQTVCALGEQSDAAGIAASRLAIALLQQKKFDAAEEAILPALAIHAVHYQALHVLARILQGTSRHTAAEHVLRTILGQSSGAAAVITRVMLCETLTSRSALSLAERDAVVADARRIFGPDHTVTRKAVSLRA